MKRADMKALAETWRVISLADLAARTGGGPSAIGYQLERADLYAHRYENGHVTKIRQTRGGMPCRDDSRLWNATGRVLTDGGPDRRERFEATLTDREREVYLAGRSEAATTTATRLGISMREWRRTWQRINAKLRETK